MKFVSTRGDTPATAIDDALIANPMVAVDISDRAIARRTHRYAAICVVSV